MSVLNNSCTEAIPSQNLSQEIVRTEVPANITDEEFEEARSESSPNFNDEYLLKINEHTDLIQKTLDGSRSVTRINKESIKKSLEEIKRSTQQLHDQVKNILRQSTLSTENKTTSIIRNTIKEEFEKIALKSQQFSAPPLLKPLHSDITPKPIPSYATVVKTTKVIEKPPIPITKPSLIITSKKTSILVTRDHPRVEEKVFTSKSLPSLLLRGYAATNELFKYVTDNQIDIVFVNEPYVGSGTYMRRCPGYHIHQFSTKHHVKACILIKQNIGSSLGISEDSTSNICIVQITTNGKKIFLISVYVEPNTDESNTINTLELFLQKTKNYSHIICGDFNGWHPLWNSSRANRRGNIIADLLTTNDLNLCNSGNVPTFETVTHNIHRESIIDLTLTSNLSSNRISNWKVDIEVCPSSGHNAITFELLINKNSIPKPKKLSTFKYHTQNVKWEQVHTTFKEEVEKNIDLNVNIEQFNSFELEQFIGNLTSAIQKSCDYLFPQKGGARNRAIWWNDELEQLKQKVIKNHHRIQQLKRRKKSLTEVIEEKTKLKTEYAQAIKTVSTNHFREFCNKQGKEDVWSVTNRLLKTTPLTQPPTTLKTKAGNYTSTTKDTAETLLNEYFPEDEPDISSRHMEIRNIELESPSKPMELLHPSKRKTIEFTEAICQQEVELHQTSSSTCIFTDGSKNENGVGAAYVVLSHEGQKLIRKYKLHNTCSIFQAEKYAIQKAIHWILSSKLHKFTIFSDSKSSLQEIQNPESTNPLTVEIHRNIIKAQALNKTIKFVWIKAHNGVLEMADKPKKTATGSTDKPPSIKRKTVTKAIKGSGQVHTDIDTKTAELPTQETQGEKVLNLLEIEEAEKLHHQTGWSAEKDEQGPQTSDLLHSSPNLDEATSSSPVLSRTGASLLRIRTQIKQARAAEAKEALKTLSETEDTAESDIDSGDTNTSLNTSTRSIGGNRMLLNDLPRHANEVLQRTKAELEKSGNLKREIRESVVSGMYTLYEMVLKLSDSRILHILESSKQKLNVSRESERLTQRHARFMHETLGQYANLKENVEKLLKETESTRSIVSYDLCEAVTATKKEIVNVRKEITLGSSISSQMQFLMEELKQLRANTDTLKNPTRQEIDLSRFAEELQELRQAVRELTKDRVIPQTQSSEHSPEIPNQEMLSEKHHKKFIEELQDHISEIKAQITAEVAELRHEILKITRDIKGITDASFNSQLPSVQANLEELRRETRELRDTTVDSAAPIRVAIESLRKELKNQPGVNEADFTGNNSQLKGDDINDYEKRDQATVFKHKSFTRTFSEVVMKPHYPEVIDVWRKSISFRATRYAPARVQTVSHNKLRVEFDNEQQRDETLTRLLNSKVVTAEPARKLRPMIILKGISVDTPTEELVDIIKMQNAELSDTITEQDDLKFCFKRSNRNPHLYNAVFRAQPTVWRKIISMCKLSIDHQRIHVEEFSPFMQCHKCYQFGHTKNKCTSENTACGHCAATTHNSENCPKRDNPDCAQCINCVAHNTKFSTKLDTKHKATSTYCPRLRAMKERIINRIDYGSTGHFQIALVSEPYVGSGNIVKPIPGINIFQFPNGHTPTFETVSYGQVRSSYIDLTLASSSIYDRIGDWKVDPLICPSSEHRAVIFSVATRGERRKTNKTTSTFRYNTNNIKWEELRPFFETKIMEYVPQNVTVEQMQANELEDYIISVTSAIQRTCDELLPRSTGRKYRCPWWTDELESLKKQVIRNHHNIQKLRRQNKPLKDALLEKERLKTAYSKTFRETSTRNFRDFCEKQGKEDVWSVTNRIIKSNPPPLPPATLKKCDGTYTNSSLETAQALLNKFFPDDDINDTPLQEEARKIAITVPNTQDEPPFTYEEIRIFAGLKVTSESQAMKKRMQLPKARQPPTDLMNFSNSQ
ncbi:unnamed protein product [Parnassius apollo]|uniref:(apollo) hypothetical protein n=1 Tax=Parnassius apollo TaxID=110799 RepID=A0A8S3W1R7_PARAO|nr:unnamed protein product [Parnassius apollo]